MINDLARLQINNGQIVVIQVGSIEQMLVGRKRHVTDKNRCFRTGNTWDRELFSIRQRSSRRIERELIDGSPATSADINVVPFFATASPNQPSGMGVRPNSCFPATSITLTVGGS